MTEDLSAEQKRMLNDAQEIGPDPHHEQQVEIEAYRDEIIAREKKRLDARLQSALNARADSAKKHWWNRLFK